MPDPGPIGTEPAACEGVHGDSCHTPDSKVMFDKALGKNLCHMCWIRTVPPGSRPPGGKRARD